MAKAALLKLTLLASLISLPGISHATPLDAGMYSARITTSNFASDTLPDSVKKSMTEPKTQHQCITPEKAAQWPLRTFSNDNCEVVKGDDTGRSFSLVVHCAVPPGETITIIASGTYSSTHFDMQSKISSVGGSHPMLMERHTVGDRTGACSASGDN